MMKKVMNQMESDFEQKEKEMLEREEEIKVKLERTETMFQSKFSVNNLFHFKVTTFRQAICYFCQ